MLQDKVNKAIEKIRPFLQRDGGDVELVDISEDGKQVRVRFHGACAGCPSANYTLKMGIEHVIREEVPEVENVEAVPYFPETEMV